ncbi:PAS domain S-box protein [uncultured Methanospirillum sp.]|uniref:PAS domain S-box protein n=1 Tax=uncultured Methanospirillum sp. TaxID=262503 RepID=UPI0029C74EA5|nr:PAS domain S-box protein [uncultured Methanospirillum sp.]
MKKDPRSFSSFSARLGIFLLVIFLVVMIVFLTNWYFSTREETEQNFRSSEKTIDQILQQSILWIDRGMYLYDLTFEAPLQKAMKIYQDEYNATGGDPEKIDYQGVKKKIENQLGDEYHVYLIDKGNITYTTDANDLGLNFSTFAPELLLKFNKIQSSDQFILDRSVKGHENNVPVRLFAYQGTADHRYLLEVGRVFVHYVPKENQAYYSDLTNVLWTLNPDIVSFDLYNSFSSLITNRSEIQLANTDNQTLDEISRTIKSGEGSVVHDEENNRDIVYTFMPVLQTDAPSTKWMNVAARTVYSTERLDHELMIITLWYIGFLVITFILALIAAFTISRYLTRPLRYMLEDIDIITAGDLTHQVRPSPHHELNRISDAINQMVGEIRSKISALSVSESRYRGLFFYSNDAILVLDGIHILDANPASGIFLGTDTPLAGAEVTFLPGPLGITISEMIFKDISHQSNQKFIERTEVLETESGYEQFLNIRINKVKGGGKYLSQVRIRDETQQQMAYRLSAQQEALKEAYRHIENILAMLPDPTFAIDANGRVIIWNKAMEEMSGISSAEIIGKGDYLYAIPFYGVQRPVLIDIVIHPELTPEGYSHIIRNGNTLFSERWFRETEPSRQYASISATALYDNQGTIIGAIESIHDITDLKNAEDAIKIANSKLNLLSNITRHDILNKVMIGRSNLFLLRDIRLTNEQKKYFTMLSQSLSSIEEFVAFTKTYQELGVEAPTWQDVMAVFIQATTNLNIDQVRVDVRISGLLIYADPLFPKVCFNLLENAVRHGGKISRVQISAEPSQAGITILVEDDGIGIPDNEKELIFERGYGKNTGYGLFLSREVLAITGIGLRETGKIGTGARFEIVVPFGRYRENRD